MNRKKTNPLLIILLLVVVFAVPMLIASWLYNKRIILGRKTNNHGVLISPPLQVEQLPDIGQSLKLGKWTLLFFSPEACAKACLEELHFLRQIQRASGKNQDRIARVLLTKAMPNTIKSAYPNLVSLTINPKIFIDFLKKNQQLNPAFYRGGIFIVDPHGNMMMAYSLKSAYIDIFKDLSHLLKVSQMG